MGFNNRTKGKFCIVESNTEKWSLFIFDCEEIEKYLINLVNENNTMIAISLKGCDFIDSKGLSILIHTSLQLKKKNGKLFLINIPEHLKETLWHARSSGLSQWNELDDEDDLEFV